MKRLHYSQACAGRGGQGSAGSTVDSWLRAGTLQLRLDLGRKTWHNWVWRVWLMRPKETDGFLSKQQDSIQNQNPNCSLTKGFKNAGWSDPASCSHPSYKVSDGPERGMIEHQGIPWIEPGENPPRLSFWIFPIYTVYTWLYVYISYIYISFVSNLIMMHL